MSLDVLFSIYYKTEFLNILFKMFCLHSWSFGSSNPSVLEAMAMKNIIVAHDNEFNREVGGQFILYFENEFDLQVKIGNVESKYSRYTCLKSIASERVKSYYSWGEIANKYDLLFKR